MVVVQCKIYCKKNCNEYCNGFLILLFNLPVLTFLYICVQCSSYSSIIIELVTVLLSSVAELYCAILGETYPCLGALIALRGNDSLMLWTTYTHSWMFELNCGNIDINKDGQMDCIGTGRFSTIVAFDPRNGLHLIH